MVDSARTLYCGNLSPEVDDDLLYELFIQAGPLERVSIPLGQNGQSRGYGFVTFKHECSVPYALQLMDGISLCGREIKVRLSSSGKPDPANQQARQHQRSFSLQEPLQGPTHGFPSNSQMNVSLPSVDALLSVASLLTGNAMANFAMNAGQYLNPLAGMANPYSGNPMAQGLLPQASQKNHHRSRSFHGGGRYYQDERYDRGSRGGGYKKGDRDYNREDRYDRGGREERYSSDQRNNRDDQSERSNRRDYNRSGGGPGRYRSRENDFHGRQDRSGSHSRPHRK